MNLSKSVDFNGSQQRSSSVNHACKNVTEHISVTFCLNQMYKARGKARQDHSKYVDRRIFSRDVQAQRNPWTRYSFQARMSIGASEYRTYVVLNIALASGSVNFIEKGLCILLLLCELSSFGLISRGFWKNDALACRAHLLDLR